MGTKREDQTFTCVQCGAQFVFSADEQDFFESRGLHSPPKRCKPCRAEKRKARRARRGGGRNKEYRGPAFKGNKSGKGVYRSPAFQDEKSGEGMYRSPGFQDQKSGEDIYTAPAFREAEGQGADLYTAPAFRDAGHPELDDGILPGRRGEAAETPPAEEEHDLESGPPPSYHEPRTAAELYTSPAFSGTDPSYGSGYKQRQMHDIVCGECGRKSQVPFKPKKDRPVYCKECFGKRRK